MPEPSILFVVLGTVLLIAAITKNFVTDKLEIKAQGRLPRIALAILGLVLLGIGIHEQFGSREPPCPSASIEAPPSGATVPREVVVTGLAKGQPSGKTLRLVAHPVVEAGWWPQGSAIAVGRESHRWEQKAYLGGKTGQRFQLAVICAGPAAHQSFAEYLAAAGQTKVYDGRPLPQPTEIIASTEVVLRE